MTTGESGQPVVVGIGEVLWDLLPGGPQPGGAPANCALHAQRLGAAAFVISSVGRDALGEAMLAHLARHRVNSDAVAVDELHPTGTVAVEVGPAGEPRFTIATAVAWDFIPLTTDVLALARRADAICFGTLAQRSTESRRTVTNCVEAAPPGCLRVFDVNLRDPFVDPARLAETLALSDVLKLNETELPRVASWLDLPSDETAALDALLERYPLRLIALTKGGRGSRLRGRAGDSVHPGFAVSVVDTVGAGDSFTAAVIVGLLDGQSLDEINERANRVASLVCGHAGAVPPAELVP